MKSDYFLPVIAEYVCLFYSRLFAPDFAVCQFVCLHLSVSLSLAFCRHFSAHVTVKRRTGNDYL